MPQIKISNLPLYTGNTTGAYLVMNNSGQTTTYKVTRESIIGASGTSGTSGSSGSNGSSGSSGAAGASGSSGSSGTSGSNGSSGSSGDSIFAVTGSVWNTTRNVGITGSLTVSGSATITGSLNVVNVLTNNFINPNNSGSVSIATGDFQQNIKIDNQKIGTGEAVLRLGKSNGVYPGNTYNAVFFLKESGSFKFQDSLETSTSSFTTRDIFVIKDNPSGSVTFSPFEIKRNTQITGSLSISGNTTITGSLIVTGSVQGNVVPLTITSNNASFNPKIANLFTLTLPANSSTHISTQGNIVLMGQSVNILITPTGSNCLVTLASNIKSVTSYTPNTNNKLDMLSLISYDTSSYYLYLPTKNLPI